MVATDKNVQCPICKSSHLRTAVVVDHGSVCTCQNCGSGVFVPPPTLEELSRLHTREEYFVHPYFEKRRQLSPENEAIAEYRLDFIERHVGELRGKTLLDVGCDNGLFVEYAQRLRNMVASGIDISERAVELGKSQGRDLYACSIENADLPKQYEVVTAYDIIEHVKDPVSFIASVLRLVRPGGFLIVETPSYLGSVHRISRLISTIPILKRLMMPLQLRMWPPFHPHYFTEHSLELILENSGCRVLAV